MYVVLVSKIKLPILTDLVPEIRKTFPSDGFSIHGSDDKGYSLHLDGVGDEREPRTFAEAFIKSWKPSLHDNQK